MKRVLIFIIFLMSINIFGQDTCYWNGSKSSNFSDKKNWVNQNKPNNILDIIIINTTIAESKSSKQFKTLIINPNSKLYIKGDLILDSLIIYSGGELIVEGNIIVNSKSKYIRTFSPYGWYNVGTPVDSHSFSIFRYYQWNVLNAKDDWNYGWQRIPSQQMEIGRGYDIYFTSEKVISFNGAINNNDQYTIIAEYYDGLEVLEHEGWNLISNPYPFTIDWNLVIKNGVDNSISIWNKDLQMYVLYVDGVSTNGGSNLIGPSQGFWIKTSQWDSIIIPKDAYVLEEYAQLKSSSINYTKLSIENLGLKTECIIRFKDSATNNYDGKYDAINKDYTIDIWSKSKDNIKSEINTFKDKSDDIFITVKSHGLTKLNIEGLEENIIDIETGEKVYDGYEFENHGENVRFKICKDIVLNTEEIENTKELKIYPNPNSGLFNVEYNGDVVIMDMYGNLILTEEINKSHRFNLNLPGGVYFINGEKIVIN